MLEVINVTTSGKKDKKRRYLDAIVNESARVTLRIPERIEWQKLKSTQSLLVNKTIHSADDGKNLALLDVVLRIDSYKDQEIIDLESLTKHKYGLMNYVRFEFISSMGDYFTVLSRNKLHKIAIHTLPESIKKALAEGYTIFFAKSIDNKICYGREEIYRVKLCK